MEMAYKIKNSLMFIIVFLSKVMNNIFCIFIQLKRSYILVSKMYIKP